MDPLWFFAIGVGLLLLGGGTAIAIAWANGRPIGEIELTSIDGRPIEVGVAAAFMRMRAAAQANGISLKLESAFRTMGEQERLYRAYLDGSGNLAAPPGYSTHQNGIAIDIRVRNSFTSPEYLWLASNAKRYGFINTGKDFAQPEPWHWEYIA